MKIKRNRYINKSHLITLTILLFVVLITACSIYNRGYNDEKNDGTDKNESFIYLGDTQSDPEKIYDYSVLLKLLRDALERKPSIQAVVIGGDLVNKEADQDEWKAFFEAAKSTGDIPIRPVSGNHTSNKSQYMDYFSIPDNGPKTRDEVFYSFDLDEMHLIMLDSNILGSQEEDVVKEISDWLYNDLRKSEKRWKIVVMHHPMYPINDVYKDRIRAEAMQKNYLDIMESGKVDLILCGHQHLYARTLPMRNGKVSEEGIIQIMSVSGGKLYNAFQQPFIDCVYNDEPVYSVLNSSEAELYINTFTASGEMIDFYEIRK